MPGKQSGRAGEIEDLPYRYRHFCQSNNVVNCRSCLMLLKLVENCRKPSRDYLAGQYRQPSF